MDNKVDRMKNLVEELNHASSLYYNGISEISDQEFDRKMDQLKKLEEETGVILSNSPSINVGAKVVSELPKVKHEIADMLSLDKCHSEQEVLDFAGTHDIIAMTKADGLSCRLTYESPSSTENAILVKAETRGNGVEGTRIDIHAKVFENIPLIIQHHGKYVVDGEVVILDNDFEEINSHLKEDEKFSNSRNLASGSLALLDSSVSAKRHLKFFAWDVIYDSNVELELLEYKLESAMDYGFDVVPFTYVSENTYSEIRESIDYIVRCSKEIGIGYDGVVFKFNNVKYGRSLGRTEKFFNNGIAFKFKDESYPTKLRYVDFTMGKTGVLTPVCHFDPVQFPDSVVEKASLHNLSVMKALGITKNCTLNVVKFNMIIPGVISCEDDGDGEIPIIDTCPICGGKTEIRKDNDSEVLVCTNPNCKGKLLGKLTHAVSRNCLNIDGLSEATIETLINRGWLTNIKDIYNLSTYKTEMTSLPGFGAKSVNKLLEAIEKSRNTTLDRFLYSLSIPLLGRSVSKDISRFCENDESIFVELMGANPLVFKKIDGIGDKLIENLEDWWLKNREIIFDLLGEFNFKIKQDNSLDSIVDSSIQGLSFCITGKLEYYKSRELFVQDVERNGGKVISGVTSKTNYLVTNDKTSGSSKNKKAQELNIPIISELEFRQMIGV